MKKKLHPQWEVSKPPHERIENTRLVGAVVFKKTSYEALQ
jgi:hypothetical protein